MQRTVLVTVGAVLVLALVAGGGFFFGRYVMESESTVRIERLKDQLEAVRLQAQELADTAEAFRQQNSDLSTELDNQSNAIYQQVQRLCAELDNDYPDPQDWIPTERELCLGD